MYKMYVASHIKKMQSFKIFFPEFQLIKVLYKTSLTSCQWKSILS